MPVGGCTVKELNTMRLIFESRPENESFARVVIAAFLVQINPTLEQVTDVKTAVSEAVTNAVVHAYPGEAEGLIEMRAELNSAERMVRVEIADEGVGIPDVDKALEPFYTTQPEMERSGMGFAVMQSFMDALTVTSEAGKGTRVVMEKRL
ncbi:MAG: anti-sigma F factor [Oscillospiraceae bacterium]|jgi:stage II sporulation protein AB (anti-sigma F factor)|nr:anti-sigma F factor [Oscillospiraceae bacterium]